MESQHVVSFTRYRQSMVGTRTPLPLHAPQPAPGVLDDPVRSPILLSIAHSQDGVVHLVRGVLAVWAAGKITQMCCVKSSL